jgi:hypothetical protein
MKEIKQEPPMPSAFDYDGKSRKITEWTMGFKKLYAVPDKYRKPEEFWNATMAHISSIGEAIRKTDYRELLLSAAHTFCWMCCYVAKCKECKDDDVIFSCDNNLSEIVGFKYPKICGHCTGNRCSCYPEEMDEDEGKSGKYEKCFKEWKQLKCIFANFALDDWLRVFWDIYSGQIHALPMESIGFHLLEEAGEEAKAVRQLVQFRGVERAGIQGIDSTFLKKISTIEGVFEEYKASIAFLKEQYKTNSEKEAKKKIDCTSFEPKVIKARIVLGKMDFFVELADTFSWFCSVLGKLLRVIEKEKLDKKNAKDFHIEEVLKKEYQSKSMKVPLVCYACRQPSCQCLFYPRAKGLTKTGDGNGEVPKQGEIQVFPETPVAGAHEE